MKKNVPEYILYCKYHSEIGIIGRPYFKSLQAFPIKRCCIYAQKQHLRCAN